MFLLHLSGAVILTANAAVKEGECPACAYFVEPTPVCGVFVNNPSIRKLFPGSCDLQNHNECYPNNSRFFKKLYIP